MFNLTEDEIQRGYDALTHHGVTGFLPNVPEWEIIVSNLATVKSQISNIDLDNYRPYPVDTIYIRKNTKFVRALEYLHPQDILIYTSLTLIFRDDIENARLPFATKKSFSYRARNVAREALYQSSGLYSKYRQRTEQRISLAKTRYITTADISQFFPHVYQHRLINALQAISTIPRQNGAARVLEKLLSRFAGGKSYGIPTGPYCSRNLAEALLIDVDAALQDKGIDFVRWMDDFTFFSKTASEAQEILGFLADWLHTNHGLVFNQLKTNIYPKHDFITDVWKTYDDEHAHFRQLVGRIRFNDYDDAVDEDVEPGDFSEILELALNISSEPKYGLIRHLIEHVIFRDNVEEGFKKAAIQKAMDEFEILEPIFDSIAKSVVRSGLFSKVEINTFCKKVLRKIDSKPIFVAGHFEAWLHWLIGEADCRALTSKIKDRFDRAKSAVVKREILIALSKIGKRQDVLFVKNNFDVFSTNERCPAIIATKLLGQDERRFWSRSQRFTDFYEKEALKLI